MKTTRFGPNARSLVAIALTMIGSSAFANFNTNPAISLSLNDRLVDRHRHD